MPVDVITRKEWGARYDDGFGPRPMPFSEFWLHHSVTIAPDLLPPFTDDDAAVRTLETIGEQRFGGGISYNQPVTPVGRVYVGVSPNREGAHTYRHNKTGFAFVLVGDYSNRTPTPEQQEAIARRMVELHRAGLAMRHTLNGGHRDSSGVDRYPTSCPGDAAHAAIPSINRRANELWALGYPANDVPQEDDMPSTEEIADANWSEPVPVGYGSTANIRASAHLSKSSYHANGAHQVGKRLEVRMVALEAGLGKMADVLAALANGQEVPTKDELLAEFRASADARMKELDFRADDDEAVQP